MRMADRQGRVLSTSEDCVSSPPPPSARVGPLSDASPFQSSAEKPPVPAPLSGPAPVQPVTLVPLSESRLNGINSSTSSSWPAPVIGQTDGKPYPTRIMRLLSNPRKCPGTGPGQATDGPSPAPGPGGVPVGGQAWTHLPGLGVIDSFKKLRSSVLQGIQSRGTANQDGECSSSHREPNGSSVSGRGPGHADAQLKSGEQCAMSNGFPADQRVSLAGQYGEEEEEEDADEEVGDGPLRNTRCSRSIRRAYGAGRISILDTGQNGAGGTGAGRPHGDARHASQGSESDVPSEGNADATVLSRLSRSAENLNLFRRKGPGPASAPAPPDPLGEPPSGTPALQRTGSVSSVGVRGRSAQRWLSPLRTKDHVLRLVGSVADLTARRRPGASPSPAAAAPPPSSGRAASPRWGSAAAVPSAG